MKKTILFVLGLLFGISFSTFAQKDAKAKELLDKSSEAFNNSGDIHADFTMNIKDVPNSLAESFNGNISIKGEKFLISTPEYAIYFDGKTQWLLQKAFDEVTISEPDEKTVQTINPASLFEIYKKGCNYKYVGEKTDIKMRKVAEVELLPQDKKNDMSKIVVQISKSDHLPVMFHIFYKNKIENIIHINKYQTKQTIPDASFSFNAKEHPDVEIIDLR